MLDRRNIIIQCPCFSLSGYGAHARDIVMSLFNSGKYNMSVVPVNWGGSSNFQPVKDVDDALLFMCNNRISQGAPFSWIQVGVPQEFRRVSSGVNVGITAGLEADVYPKEWAAQCNQMTAIIVPSTFVRDKLIECGVQVPVHVVPEGVNTRVFSSELESPSDLDFPTSFNFLTVGQWLPGNIGEDRKNIPLAIHAVLDAFPDNPEVGIVVKTYLHNNSSPDRYATFDRLTDMFGARAKGRVHIVHGTLTDDELRGLYRHPKVKAFVSLTHGEGYFRPLAEAAACDIPVLVTGWSGHMDYIKPEMATVLEYGMTQIPPASWAPNLLGPNQKWASPDFEKAKNRLKRCHSGYAVAVTRAQDLGRVMRRDWSLERSDAIMVDVMDIIMTPTGTEMAQVGRIVV